MIQLLNYVQNLDYQIEKLGETSYRRISFKLNKFLQYKNPERTKNSRHEFNRSKIFFKNLQTNWIVEDSSPFQNIGFSSLIAIPKVQVRKVSTALVVDIWLVENLFHYQYPYELPNLFHKSLTKSKLRVNWLFFSVFTSTRSTKKLFNIPEFFDDYPAQLSNKQKLEIKEYLIGLIQTHLQEGLIESSCELLSSKESILIKELMPQDISEGFIIYEVISRR